MIVRMLLCLLLTVACAALGPQAAVAHASLMGAEPADGAVLRQAPDRIILHYTEPVSPLVLRLVGPGGEATDLDHVATAHDALEITLPPGLRDGAYALSWRVISADGHPISGSLVFSIGAPTSRQAANAVQTSRIVQVSLWSARLLIYAGAFLGAGSAFFAAWIAGRSKLWGWARREVVVSLWVGLFASLLSLGLQGLDALALPLSGLSRGAVWRQGFETSFGLTVLLAVAAQIGGLLSLSVTSRWLAKALSGAALIGIGVAFAASGHASTAEPQWLTRTSVFVHVVGIAFWVGALVPLFAMLRSSEPQAVGIMNRFSAAILPVVILLIAAGVILAIVQVGSIPALWNTAYGVILLLKTLAVGALLVLAAANRLVFTPALAKDQPRQREWFARSIAAECVLVVAILGLVAGWRFTPPPRAVTASAAPAAEAPARVSIHLHSEQAMAQVTFTPGRAGKTTVTITLVSGSGAPLTPKEVTLSLSQPASGIEPLERNAVRAGQGPWRIDDLVLPVGGEWQVEVQALVSDFDQITLEGTVSLPR